MRVKEIISVATPPRAALAPGVVLAVLADACVVALLALSIWLLVRAGEQPPILYLNFAVVGVRALAIGRAVFRYLERLTNHDAAFKQLAKLRVSMFSALLPRVPAGLGNSKRGEVLSGFVDDVDQLQDESLRVRLPLLSSSLVLLLSCTALAIVSVPASIVTLVAMLLALLVSVLAHKYFAEAGESELSAARAQLNDFLLERVENAEVFATFRSTTSSNKKVLHAANRLANIENRQAFSAGMTAASYLLLSGVATLLVLFLLRDELSNGEISAPVFTVLVVVPAAIAEVFMLSALALNARKRVIVSATKLSQLTSQDLPAALPSGAMEHINATNIDSVLQLAEQLTDSDAEYAIELSNVSVSYPQAAEPVLRNFSCKIVSGDKVLITGPSGAGKSTLANTLVRFLEYSGSYKLFGAEAKDIGGAVVRRVVGLCEQQPHIFNSTLRQNLLFAYPQATDSELWAVLRRVGLSEWARSRAGLETNLGTDGSLISGGQAQRIAVARALLADFKIFIFDEPVAGVDKRMAQLLLRDLLSALPNDKTVVLISHVLPDNNFEYRQLEITAE